MAWEPDYTTLTDLKNYINIPDDVDDVQLSSAITAASRAVDASAGRQFGQVAAPEERAYTARWDGGTRTWSVDIDDLMTDVGLEVAYAGAEVTGASFRPSNAVLRGRPWTRMVVASGLSCSPEAVAVTASWGWTAVPAPIEQATLMQAARLFKRRSATLGIAELGDSPAMRLFNKVDPDVEVIVRPYARVWGAR